MRNYTYIVVNADGTIINDEDYRYIYETIILHFHYPICLNITLELSKSEKTAIKTNEFAFVKSKMPEHIKIYQIPRILYDLFLILHKYTVLYKTPVRTYTFNNNTQNYESYCIELNDINEQIYNDIWKLNNFIVEYLINKRFNFQDATYIDYLFILNSIVRDFYTFINVTFLRAKQNYYKTKKKQFVEFVKKYINSICDNRTYLNVMEKFLIESNIYSGISYFDKQCIISLILGITQHLKDDDIRKIIFPLRYKSAEETYRIFSEIVIKIAEDDVEMEKIITIYNTLFKNFFVEFVGQLNITLVHKVLIQEISGSPTTAVSITKTTSKSMATHDKTTRNTFSKRMAVPSKFILYRGAVDTKESAINQSRVNQGYSLSYNTSLLNGIISDKTACTYYYMQNDKKYGDLMYKHKYNLSRFFYGDDSSEDKLFFIPPFHPYLQMLSSGEFWHSRSKIYTGSYINNVESFNMLYTSSHGVAGIDYEEYIAEMAGNEKTHAIPEKRYTNFPDYLTSSYTRDQIEDKFTRFIKMHRSKVQDNEELEHTESNLFGGTRKHKRS